MRFVNVTPDSRSILSDRSFAYLRQCWFVKIKNALVVAEQTQSASFSSLPVGIGLWKCGFWGERKPGVCEWRKFHLTIQEQKSPTNSTPMCFPLWDLSRHHIDVRCVLAHTLALAYILLCYCRDACINNNMSWSSAIINGDHKLSKAAYMLYIFFVMFVFLLMYRL